MGGSFRRHDTPGPREIKQSRTPVPDVLQAIPHNYIARLVRYDLGKKTIAKRALWKRPDCCSSKAFHREAAPFAIRRGKPSQHIKRAQRSVRKSKMPAQRLHRNECTQRHFGRAKRKTFNGFRFCGSGINLAPCVWLATITTTHSCEWLIAS